MLIALAIALLALVHLAAGRSGLLEKDPSLWKSVSAGVGISYAFLVLLPKIAAAQHALEGATTLGFYGYLENHAYLVALAGLVLHFGVDVAVERVLVMPARRPWRAAVTLLVVAHASSLFGYFFLIGYLVAKTPPDQAAVLALFTLAMVVHSLAIGHGLLRKYGGLFDRVLRWLFMAAPVLGALVAVAAEIPYGALALLNSLFAGMLIIATIKEKIPGSADARIGPFLAGVVGYSLLLLLAGS